MPKAREDRIVSDDGTMKVIEITTAGGGEEKLDKTVQYAVPSSAAAFRDLVAKASESPDDGAFVKAIFGPDRDGQNEAPLAFIYRMFTSAIDKAVRASVYEAVQAASTWISVGGGNKVDLMTFPANKLVVAINGMRGKRSSDLMLLGIADADAPEHAAAVKSVDRKLNYNQFSTAGCKLVETGKARENTASGMLELVA